MDDVVKLEASTTTGPSSETRESDGRPQRSKTALVLGGGGFTGAVYEIGALRALNLLSVNRTVNEFDVYVGTSAGSFVAAVVANGISPEQMMRTIVRQGPTSFPDLRLSTLLKPNYSDFVKKGLQLPLRLARGAGGLARGLRQLSAVDLVVGLAGALPSGLYSGEGLERYVRTLLTAPERTDDFRLLTPELYLVATDLDTCERIVFGAEGWDDVPISTAVSASSAVPMLYRPVKVNGRELIDGGIVSTTNIDIAVQAGARLIVVVNPLVPYVNDLDHRLPSGSGQRARRVSDMGFAQIGYQSFRLLAYQRLHELARTWKERYPGVDIILIEPEPNDELMFETSMMNYTSRVAIARHGFQSVTLKLAHDYPRFKSICARHGIEISATRVQNVIRDLKAEPERTQAWRRILEQTTSTLLRQSSEGADPAARQ